MAAISMATSWTVCGSGGRIVSANGGSASYHDFHIWWITLLSSTVWANFYFFVWCSRVCLTCDFILVVFAGHAYERLATAYPKCTLILLRGRFRNLVEVSERKVFVGGFGVPLELTTPCSGKLEVVCSRNYE